MHASLGNTVTVAFSGVASPKSTWKQRCTLTSVQLNNMLIVNISIINIESKQRYLHNASHDKLSGSTLWMQYRVCASEQSLTQISTVKCCVYMQETRSSITGQCTYSSRHSSKYPRQIVYVYVCNTPITHSPNAFVVQVLTAPSLTRNHL